MNVVMSCILNNIEYDLIEWDYIGAIFPYEMEDLVLELNLYYVISLN